MLNLSKEFLKIKGKFFFFFCIYKCKTLISGVNFLISKINKVFVCIEGIEIIFIKTCPIVLTCIHDFDCKTREKKT